MNVRDDSGFMVYRAKVPKLGATSKLNISMTPGVFNLKYLSFYLAKNQK